MHNGILTVKPVLVTLRRTLSESIQPFASIKRRITKIQFTDQPKFASKLPAEYKISKNSKDG